MHRLHTHTHTYIYIYVHRNDYVNNNTFAPLIRYTAWAVDGSSNETKGHPAHQFQFGKKFIEILNKYNYTINMLITICSVGSWH
jgi:hypothetical protein